MFGRGSGIPDVSSRPCYARLKHFLLVVFLNFKGGTGTFKLGRERERCSSMVRAFAHGAIGRRIDP